MNKNEFLMDESITQGPKSRGIITISFNVLLEYLGLSKDVVSDIALLDAWTFYETLCIKIGSPNPIKDITWYVPEGENIPRVSMDNKIPKKKIGIMVFKGDTK